MKPWCSTDGESVRVGGKTYRTETLHEGDLDGTQITVEARERVLKLKWGPYTHFFRRNDDGAFRQYKRRITGR